jgi:predicted site-specific integrase-resolvase
MPTILTISAVAEADHVPVNTLQKACKNGLLGASAWQSGDIWLIDHEHADYQRWYARWQARQKRWRQPSLPRGAIRVMAEALGVSRQTVYAWRRNGTLLRRLPAELQNHYDQFLQSAETDPQNP